MKPPRLGDPEATQRFESLVGALLGDDDAERERASMFLPDLGPAAVGPLLELLADEAVRAFAEAFRALVDALSDFLVPEVPVDLRLRIVDGVGEALLRLRVNRVFAAWHGADVLAGAVGFDAKEEAGHDGRIVARAREWLVRILRAETAAVRMAALYALVASGSRGALAEVSRVAASDPDEQVREMAGRAAACLERGARDLSLDRMPTT